jgi:hypothetical protein
MMSLASDVLEGTPGARESSRVGPHTASWGSKMALSDFWRPSNDRFMITCYI